jgi:uncharacterized protein with von Willebrand factor type A (vWA) domain
MYPYGDFPGNLAAFCGVLRRTHGFRLGPGELRDAARALDVVDVADERHVRHALRTVLSSSLDNALAFDDAFDAFFFPGPEGVPQPGLPSHTRRDERPGADDTEGERLPPSGDRGADTDLDEGEGGTGPIVIDDESREGEHGIARTERASYSPLEAEGLAAVRLEPVNREWHHAAGVLVRRLHLGLSRRWRPGSRGRRFDLRRTWRASLQTGGEALTARWLRRRRRSPRFVVLIDGSRSMAGADRAALDLAVSIASVTRRIETFVFSTALKPITREVRLAAAGRTVHIDLGREAWGGGTNIGASLRTFLQLHGERHVGRETLAVIVSDGLDIGEPDLLRAAMRELHRRAAGVAWINPLLDTPGYEPTSRGMAAARPFVTTFASVPDASGLTRLARLVRMR